MTGRFAGLSGVVPDEPQEAPAPAPVEPARRPRRAASPHAALNDDAPTPVSQSAPRRQLVQARVEVKVRRDFARALLDIQDYFDREVTQEEAIAALLTMAASDDPAFRNAWIRKVQELRN